MHKPTSAEEYKLIGNFHAVRKTLLHSRFDDRLDRPLAYWALPNDRRLPLAFLGRTLRELLETPFEDLAATPGIGQKKMGTLIKLLNRATKEQPRFTGDGSGDGAAEKKPAVNDRAKDGFDPAQVSEAVWETWRDTVVKHGVDCEKFGRLASTLQSLPTVIWHTPLETYCDYSVSEIRQLKTHGEKRVRTILEVFASVHALLANAHPREHLSVRLLPKFVIPVECWIDEAIDGRSDLPSREDVRKSLVVPLLEQIQRDTGPTVSRLAEGRLGVNSEAQTVRQQSRRMGVTRARVYQLLEDCAKVMAVRWPEGHGRLNKLTDHLEKSNGDSDAHELLRAVIELFYPDADELAARAAQDGEA